jgi:hypothetical protein
LLNKARSGERKTVQKQATDYRLKITERKKIEPQKFLFTLSEQQGKKAQNFFQKEYYEETLLNKARDRESERLYTSEQLIKNYREKKNRTTTVCLQ